MEQTKEIRSFIGQKLAEGLCSQEIVELLTDKLDLASSLAIGALKTFYKHWQDVLDVAQIETPDQLNWHVYMRHVALQMALADSKPGTALSILDSLAKLQKLFDLQDERMIPLQVILVAKKEEEVNVKDDTTREPEQNSIKE